MGAWIETAGAVAPQYELAVAPYVGAWIETGFPPRLLSDPRVAPYVGAWIETTYPFKPRSEFKSHPTWVRGLKLHLERTK